MREQSIGGVLDLGVLSAPPGICVNCYAVFKASKPRPPFVWCHHTRTAAKQRGDRTWKTLTDLTKEQVAELDELAKLQAGHEQP